jgi:plasmid maintenance system killer protein
MAVTAALSPSNLPQSSTGRFDVNSVDDMQDPEELRSLSAWKVHTLTGDRKGSWSLSVTRNRRIWRSALKKPLE